MPGVRQQATSTSQVGMRAVAGRALPWVIPVFLLLLWQWASSAGILPPRFLPAPRAVISAFVTSALPANCGLMSESVPCEPSRDLPLAADWVSCWDCSQALCAGPRPSSTPRFKWSATFLPWPSFPLVILWFGIDETAKLFLVALGVFFPVYINTFHGIRSVDRGLLEMGRSYGLSGWRLYREIILPGALPSILVGVRFSLGFMWVILIVAETISARSGIGYMTMNAREFMQTDVMVVGILLVRVTGETRRSSGERIGTLLAALESGLSSGALGNYVDYFYFSTDRNIAMAERTRAPLSGRIRVN